jgi:hypothetical protein
MMRKREMVSIVRNVMVGKSGYTHIVFGMRHDNRWDVEININKIEIDPCEWQIVGRAKHCCDNITLSEVEAYIEEQL